MREQYTIPIRSAPRMGINKCSPVRSLYGETLINRYLSLHKYNAYIHLTLHAYIYISAQHIACKRIWNILFRSKVKHFNNTHRVEKLN